MSAKESQLLPKGHPYSAISVLVMAAGSSSRMKAWAIGDDNSTMANAHPNTHKLLLPLFGKPVLAHTLERLCTVSFGEIVVVTGFERERIEEVCARFSKVQTVWNPNAAEGMASSLRTGVAVLHACQKGILILLADMPLVRTETLERLCQHFHQASTQQSDTQPIVVPVYRGQRGNPVLFSALYKPELLTLQGDTGARRLLRTHADHVVECHTDDEGVLLDLDTPEQWQALVNRGA
jgi:molybdenum cofactor cytidylyltransferase